MLALNVACPHCGAENEYQLQNLGVGTTSRFCDQCSRLMLIEFSEGRVKRVCPGISRTGCRGGTPFRLSDFHPRL